MNAAIEITGRLVEHPAGIAKYIEKLYRNLGKENVSLFPYVYFPRKKYIKQLSSFININDVSWHYSFLHNEKSKNKIDISHTTDVKFLNLPKTKKIATIHDLAIFKKELSHIPNYTTDSFRKKIMKNLETLSKQTDGIITVSEQTKNDFLELFPSYNKERIKTIYLASSLPEIITVDTQKALDKFNLKAKSYFIFTGAVSARK
ncbi:MAG TPA: glycosyltransferase, partial [Ignavibacteria bacterium]